MKSSQNQSASKDSKTVTKNVPPTSSNETESHPQEAETVSKQGRSSGSKEDDNNTKQSAAKQTSTSRSASSISSEDSSHRQPLEKQASIKTVPQFNSSTRPIPPNQIKTLLEMKDLGEADCFVQLIEKEKLRTKDGKPYYKVTFRDRHKSVQSIFWLDNPKFMECEKEWKPGNFFKIRGAIRDSGYGPKLEIRRIRAVVPEDSKDGFTPRKCQPSSAQPPEELAAALLAIADKQIGKGPLLALVRRIFKEYRLSLFEAAASRVHHRTYMGGLLEHTLSVTKLAITIYNHFCVEFPTVAARVSKPLLVAGAILHDVGKVLDSQTTFTGAEKTLAGNLINHQILGVGIVQRFAAEARLDAETTCQLEHLILSHSRFPDWGSPTPPQSLEAMLLHYADYADSTFVSSMKIQEEDVSPERFTARKGPFGVPLLKPNYQLNFSLRTPESNTNTHESPNQRPNTENVRNVSNPESAPNVSPNQSDSGVSSPAPNDIQNK